MRRGADSYLGQRGGATTRRPGNPDTFRDFSLILCLQCTCQLMQDDGNAAGKLLCGSGPFRSLRNLRLASGDELLAVVRQKLVHWSTPVSTDRRRRWSQARGWELAGLTGRILPVKSFF